MRCDLCKKDIAATAKFQKVRGDPHNGARPTQDLYYHDDDDPPTNCWLRVLAKISGETTTTA